MLRTNLKSVPDFDKPILLPLCSQNIIGNYRYKTICVVAQTSHLTSNLCEASIISLFYNKIYK